MRRYLVFLFYYCLVVTVGLFVWSVGFAPQPTGLMLVALLIPMCIYFLLAMAHKKAVVAEGEIKGSGVKLTVPLVILATLFVSTISILIFSIAKTVADVPSSQTVELAKQIADVKELLMKSESQDAQKIASDVKDVTAKANQANALGIATLSAKTASPSAGEVGFVTIADKTNMTINAYKDASFTSPVMGKVAFGKTYLFLKKIPDWYFISLSSDVEGWVSAQYMKEVSGTSP